MPRRPAGCSHYHHRQCTNTLALDSLPTFYDPSDPSCLQVPVPSYYMADSAKKVKSKKRKEKKNNLK